MSNIFKSICKNVIISETEQDRAISTKFLTHRVSAESTGHFSQKSFSRHFLVAILNLRKTEKDVYLGNGAR